VCFEDSVANVTKELSWEGIFSEITEGKVIHPSKFLLQF
jgi:hypothetical protein